MGKLVLRLPDGSTREIPLERERLTIGRRADNDICLPFPAVSGEHAAVVTIFDDSFLEDLGSTNGTLVNGKAITKHFLRDHDEIDIGRQTLVYLSGDFMMPAQTSIEGPMRTVAVTENGGATIGDDEATVVPPARERKSIDTLTLPIDDATAFLSAPTSSAPEPELRPQHAAHMASDVVARNDAPADAPSLEVLDGPSAGCIVQIGREDFVFGRLGVQIAAVRRTPEGFRLLPLEGDAPPRINGAVLAGEGSLLALGDEIEIAGTRLLYRPPL
jgi:pSer/pThr/pTyr-binding forkhead associated (FHA) protein